ncbi:MAG TPA: hypothetical protein VGL13_15105 [Polyangiaceae bacterium]|jgi:hypothetical protein
MITRKNEPRRPISMGKVILGVVVLLGVVIGGFALYTFSTLNISYADGERSGMLQKFSRKGWVCKTWEGEVALSYLPGVAPVLWDFSVRDQAVADKVNDVLGKNVVLHYQQHRGVPTECFGETEYFVDDVRVVK